jgi:hypothetical protein
MRLKNLPTVKTPFPHGGIGLYGYDNANGEKGQYFNRKRIVNSFFPKNVQTFLLFDLFPKGWYTAYRSADFFSVR